MGSTEERSLNPTGTEGFVWVALSYFQMPRERKSSLMSCSVLCERSLERRHRPRHLENQTDNNEWLVLRTCWLFTQNSIKVTRSQKKETSSTINVSQSMQLYLFASGSSVAWHGFGSVRHCSLHYGAAAVRLSHSSTWSRTVDDSHNATVFRYSGIMGRPFCYLIAWWTFSKQSAFCWL